LKATLYVSGRGLARPKLKILDCNDKILAYTSRRVFFCGFRCAIREIQLQYLGYELSVLKATILAIRNHLSFVIRNPRQGLLELIFLHAFTVDLGSMNNLPLKVNSQKGNQDVWIARNAIQTGIRGFNFGSEIEWDRIRKTGDYQTFVWLLEIGDENSAVMTLDETTVRRQLPIRDGLRIEKDLYQGSLNLRNIYQCEVFNGLFSIKNDSVTYVDDSNYIDDYAWPTNLLFQFNTSLSIIDLGVGTRGHTKKAILFGSSSSWFHFLVEVLPRFLLLEEFDFTEYVVIVRGKMPHPITEVLESLGVKSIITMLDGEKVYVDELITLTDLRYKDVTNLEIRRLDLSAVRKYILDIFPQSAGPGRIFLERDEKLFRTLSNRQDLQTMLQNMGFECIKPELLTVAQQVNLFTNADIVVAESGAALTNIIFMKHGSKVLEIHPGNDQAGLWASLGAVFGVEVNVVYGHQSRIWNMLTGGNSFKVDLNKIRNQVQNFSSI